MFGLILYNGFVQMNLTENKSYTIWWGEPRRRNATSLNLKEAAAPILRVIEGHLASNRGRFVRLYAGWACFTRLLGF